MPVLLHQQPVLTLALESFQDATIDENDIRRMWIIFTKCKDDIKNGFRLENISWRIWYKKYLNNTTDLFSNDKMYNQKSVNNSKCGGSTDHSVESTNSSFSTIEPIEVLKKCACGEQLISSSHSSLSTPHSEYTCFDKQTCQHHHSSSSKQNSSTTTKNESNTKTSITENQDTTSTRTEKTVVEIPKEESCTEKESTQKVIDNKESSNVKKETVVAKDEQTSIQHTNSSSTDTNNTTINGQTNNSTTIPPNCPTIEQFYQQQLLLVQQVYIQKQQQLQYQKQQVNANPEQIYQQQLYLQQWFNQQQQQLMANCSRYYKAYLQKHFSVGVTKHQPHPSNQQLEDDYDDEDDDDDYYYSDEDDDDFNDDDDDYDDGEYEESKPESESKKDDLFKKVSTPTLKEKMTKPSLLSAMIKENSYNEYKKTVEIIQKYDDDAQKVSNNIYSIKDYNHNCINSLNKNERRKRAPSFEDVRNARKLFEMRPLYPQGSTAVSESGHDDVEEYYEKGHSHQNTYNSGNPNSYSTINTVASQDSHCTVFSNHSHMVVDGSNKTPHSIVSNRASTNNSVNLYLNKKRVN